MHQHNGYVGALTDSYFRGLTGHSNPETLTPEQLTSFGISEYIQPEPEPVIYIPQSITKRQCCLMLELTQEGLYDQVEATVSTMSKLAQISWRTAAFIYRNDEFVVQMAGMLGWTTEQTDNFFIEADKL